jgi:hypothetical protein
MKHFCTLALIFLSACTTRKIDNSSQPRKIADRLSKADAYETLELIHIQDPIQMVVSDSIAYLRSFTLNVIEIVNLSSHKVVGKIEFSMGRGKGEIESISDFDVYGSEIVVVDEQQFKVLRFDLKTMQLLYEQVYEIRPFSVAAFYAGHVIGMLGSDVSYIMDVPGKVFNEYTDSTLTKQQEFNPFYSIGMMRGAKYSSNDNSVTFIKCFAGFSLAEEIYLKKDRLVQTRHYLPSGIQMKSPEVKMNKRQRIFTNSSEILNSLQISPTNVVVAVLSLKSVENDFVDVFDRKMNYIESFELLNDFEPSGAIIHSNDLVVSSGQDAAVFFFRISSIIWGALDLSEEFFKPEQEEIHILDPALIGSESFDFCIEGFGACVG